MAGPFVRVAAQSCFAIGPATTSWWRSPACGSPCTRPAPANQRRAAKHTLNVQWRSGPRIFSGVRAARADIRSTRWKAALTQLASRTPSVATSCRNPSREYDTLCRSHQGPTWLLLTPPTTCNANPYPSAQPLYRGSILRRAGPFVALTLRYPAPLRTGQNQGSSALRQTEPATLRPVKRVLDHSSRTQR
jgi:hypothetical protein